jgi:hypothetical protein
VEVIERIFKMHFLFKAAIPLAPGFSPVFDRRTGQPFQRLFHHARSR